MGSLPELPPAYAELHCLSNFSFLRGASHAQELVGRAAELGYSALAIIDECSLAGIVRAHVAAKDRKFKLIVGSEFVLGDGLKLVLLAPDRKAYGALASLITVGRRRAKKGPTRFPGRIWKRIRKAVCWRSGSRKGNWALTPISAPGAWRITAGCSGA